MCGGTARRSTAACGGRGPSPRVRGNRGPVWAVESHHGAIPACAGEPATASTASGACGRADRGHPRVCGGTLIHHYQSPVGEGPSPRVRGNRFIWTCGVSAAGAIPACAGEPFARRGDALFHRGHPRVCGGTAARPCIVGHNRGPSPRVRGNPAVIVVDDAWLRAIPACAGEPPSARIPDRS